MQPLIYSMIFVSVFTPLLSLHERTPTIQPSVTRNPVDIVVVTPPPAPVLPPKVIKPYVPSTKSKPTHIVSKPVRTEHGTHCTSRVRIDLVEHAYKISKRDMKFIGTIASESMFDVGAIGDSGNSLGLCQFHVKFQPDNHRAYQNLKTDKEKLEFCYSKYKIWDDKGIIEKRLHGSRVWKKGIEKLNIKCN